MMCMLRKYIKRTKEIPHPYQINLVDGNNLLKTHLVVIKGQKEQGLSSAKLYCEEEITLNGVNIPNLKHSVWVFGYLRLGI